MTPGLCGDCLHARRVSSTRGTTFFLCERAADDPAYRRYPSLPVLSCPGYEPPEGPRRGPADDSS